jgi:hypothetical protein
VAFAYKNLVKTPISKLKVGDLIFGSGGMGEDRYDDVKIERAEDEHGASFQLLLRFYRILKINPSSFWILDVLERKRYKMARWYWDGSGEMVVRKVPEKYKKEVESELVDSALQYRLENNLTKPVASVRISIR